MYKVVVILAGFTRDGTVTGELDDRLGMTARLR